MSQCEDTVSVKVQSSSHDTVAVLDMDDCKKAPVIANPELVILPEPTTVNDRGDMVVLDKNDKSPNKTGLLGLAPTLRVEQLRDEDNVSISSYTSDEEGGMHAGGSDIDGNHSDRGAPNQQTRELEEFVTPDDELRTKIVNQVEFYFSDVNILKDAFLLKHVHRNKQGYVSIKLITSFKKVKSMTKDFRVVAHSLRTSEKLEVNQEGTKVRRKEALPDFDETTPSRTVVVVNLPLESPTIEGIAEMFSKCGEVELIRIIRPGKSIPQDVKKYSSKHPEIGTTVCAVVEFENHECAKKACDLMTNSDDWRKGMRVVLLAVPKKKDKDAKKKVGKKEDEAVDGGLQGENENNVENEKTDDNKDGEKKRRKRGGRKKKRVDELTNERESSCYSSGSEAECVPNSKCTSSTSLYANQNTLDPNRLSTHSSPRTSPRSSPLSSPRSQRRRGPPGKSPLLESPRTSPRPSPRSSPEMGRKRADYSSGGDSSPSSPWVQRRIKAAQELSPLAQNASPHASPLLGRRNRVDMIGVTRQPRGPDGTNGFYSGKGRGLPLTSLG